LNLLIAQEITPKRAFLGQIGVICNFQAIEKLLEFAHCAGIYTKKSFFMTNWCKLQLSSFQKPSCICPLRRKLHQKEHKLG